MLAAGFSFSWSLGAKGETAGYPPWNEALMEPEVLQGVGSRRVWAGQRPSWSGSSGVVVMYRKNVRRVPMDSALGLDGSSVFLWFRV